VEVEEV